MGRPGFEPGTNRLKAEYSTVELATLSLNLHDLSYHSITAEGFVKGVLEEICRQAYSCCMTSFWFQHR